MACLTVDRYLSVFLPGRLRGGYIRRNSNAAISVSFLLGFLVRPFYRIKKTRREKKEGELGIIHLNSVIPFLLSTDKHSPWSYEIRLRTAGWTGRGFYCTRKYRDYFYGIVERLPLE